MTRIRDVLLDALFPVACLSCNAWGTWMCPEHFPRLPQKEAIHLEGFSTIRSIGSYANPTIQQLVRGLKFSGYRECARVLGLRMARQLRSVLYTDAYEHTVLVPLPLSRWRLNTRGFNQAALLAEAIGQDLSLPVLGDALQRRHRTPQSDTAHEQRTHNIQGVFSVTRPRAFYGKRIVLVDDVVTTGSTLIACHQAIRAVVSMEAPIGLVAAHGG